MTDNRKNKINYYLDIADSVSERSTCLRKNYGAVLVKDDRIISTGYNGSARGRINCTDDGFCPRETLGIKSGEHYELCRAVHAEMNAIIAATYSDMIGSTLYLSGKEYSTGEYIENMDSCIMCKRAIINAQVDTVVFRDNEIDYRLVKVEDWKNINDFSKININHILPSNKSLK